MLYSGVRVLYVHVDVLYGHEYALGLVEELYEKTTFVARVERLPARVRSYSKSSKREN